eukprot:2050750-Prymnesium_polylepis.1
MFSYGTYGFTCLVNLFRCLTHTARCVSNSYKIRYLVHRYTGAALATSRPAPVPRVDRYGIGTDPSKRSAPGFAVSGDGGELSGQRIARADRHGWVGAM